MSEELHHHESGGQECTIPPTVFEPHYDREGPTVHIMGTLTKILPDDTDGDKHQRFEVRVDDIRCIGNDYENHEAPQKRDFLKVAVHYGGHDGLGIGEHPIPNLQAGEKIELQGEYIRHAKVLHFTHHPLGFIEYHGKRYE